MRRSATTYRRLKSGTWQQSVTLTTPYPEPVHQLLAEWSRRKGEQMPELVVLDQSIQLTKACQNTSDSNAQP